MTASEDVATEKLAFAIAALRKLAIIPVAKKGVPRMEYVGHRCRVCSGAWNLDQAERHTETCPLEGSKPHD